MSKEQIRKITLPLFGIAAGLLLAEILLRLLGVGITYSEQREGVFVNPAERMEKSWYVTHPPFFRIELKTPDYNYPRTTNSEGLSDKEWSAKKDSDEIRIITLGDSFTEGDGSPYDSSYPRILERLIKRDFPAVKINVMNAGRIGSDPWFEYKKLKDRLLKYQPDIVVYTNSSNDLLYDHLNYGGMERFTADSGVINKIPQPGWLGIYAASYVFRLAMQIAGYDITLFSSEDREKNKITAIADANQLSAMYSALAKENNFTCIQLLRPVPPEIEEGHYEFNAAELIRNTDTLPNYFNFDILRYYMDSLQINQSNVYDYYWRLDGHHNSKGYEAMAKAVYSVLKPEVAKRVPSLLQD